MIPQGTVCHFLSSPYCTQIVLSQRLRASHKSAKSTRLVLHQWRHSEKQTTTLPTESKVRIQLRRSLQEHKRSTVRTILAERRVPRRGGNARYSHRGRGPRSILTIYRQLREPGRCARHTALLWMPLRTCGCRERLLHGKNRLTSRRPRLFLYTLSNRR